LASALQNEIERRRKAAATEPSKSSTPLRVTSTKPELKHSKVMPAGMVKNDRHDQVNDDLFG